jgi:hypothetical protein
MAIAVAATHHLHDRAYPKLEAVLVPAPQKKNFAVPIGPASASQ